MSDPQHWLLSIGNYHHLVEEIIRFHTSGFVRSLQTTPLKGWSHHQSPSWDYRTWPAGDEPVPCLRCFGSLFSLWCGSGSDSSLWCGCGPGSCSLPKVTPILRPLFYRQILHGSFMNLHASIASGQGSPWLLSEPLKSLNFDTVK